MKKTTCSFMLAIFLFLFLGTLGLTFDAKATGYSGEGDNASWDQTGNHGPDPFFGDDDDDGAADGAGSGAAAAGGGGGDGVGVIIPQDTGLPDPGGQYPVISVIANVLEWILIAFILLSVISFIITGIQYMLSFGDTYRAEKAKNNFVYSIIAVTLVCGALIIILTIDSLLS